MLFELKGREGDEEVNIVNNIDDKPLDTVKLTKNWQKFSYVAVRAVRINYIVDERGENPGDVFFRETGKFEITYKGSWDKWSCGKPNENEQCSKVRDGRFIWGGNYLVSLKGGM